MIFVLAMLFTFVYDRKDENHWSLLVTHYSLFITHYSEYKWTYIMDVYDVFYLSKV